MEKLLHERLRELTTEEHYDIISVLGERLDCIGTGWQGVLSAIADEIEKCYIPRPRFEDGEPVQFGDEIKGCDGKLLSLLLYDDGSGYAYGIHDNWMNQPLDGLELYPKRPLERPALKVLDADGVEIKVGDTVYETHKDEALTVYEVNSQYVHAKTESGGIRGNLTACYLTHEQPVFDAEGVRICKDDTVWHVGDSSRGTVIGVIIDNTWHGYPVKVAWDKGDEGFYQGDALTHQEPDSLEKLYKDMRSNERMQGYRYADRLLALIERDA